MGASRSHLATPLYFFIQVTSAGCTFTRPRRWHNRCSGSQKVPIQQKNSELLPQSAKFSLQSSVTMRESFWWSWLTKFVGLYYNFILENELCQWRVELATQAEQVRIYPVYRPWVANIFPPLQEQKKKLRMWEHCNIVKVALLGNR